MFGLFNSKKQISNQIAVAISNTFRASLGSEFIDENGDLNAPDKFWSDEYIVGFISVLISLFLKYDFKGDAFSAEKKGEIVNLVLMQLCKKNSAQVHDIFLKNTNAESDLFKKGGDEGLVVYIAIMGRLKSDSDNPLVKQAKSLVEMRSEYYSQNAKIFGKENSVQSNISLALIELTLLRHIKENYKDDTH